MEELSKKENRVEKNREESFASRAATKIWKEESSPGNPYLADKSLLHGYNILELAQKKSFVEVLYLLFKGELPEPKQVKLLEILFVGLINPGPRHPAIRAVMEAGVSKTDVAHLLPLGLMVLSGEHLGASEVEASIRFIRKNMRYAPEKLIESLGKDQNSEESPFPGFGSRFNGVDYQTQQLAEVIAKQSEADSAIAWCSKLVLLLNEKGKGWYPTGLAAAVFADLGFNPRLGAGLFQLLSAPGILAHGVEMAGKGIQDMPFVAEEDFHYIND